MTKEEAKKLIPVITALAEGKTIQYLDCGGNWIDRYDLSFDDNPSKYRIKPEPKLVPFTLKDKKEFLGKVVKHKKSNWFAIVNAVSEPYVHVSEDRCDYEYFLKSYEFEDGSPCGKYVEE